MHTIEMYSPSGKFQVELWADLKHIVYVCISPLSADEGLRTWPKHLESIHIYSTLGESVRQLI